MAEGEAGDPVIPVEGMSVYPAGSIVTVRLAHRADISALGPIEAAAGAIFATVDMEAIANGDTAGLADLELAQLHDRLWVAVMTYSVAEEVANVGRPAVDQPDRDEGDCARGRVVGFLMASLVDGVGHLDEVSVHPDAAGQRVGARLIGEFLEWGRANHFPRLTLTTFADVPWNRPYYERLGFVVVETAALTAALKEQVATEAKHGLDPALRVVMEYPLSATPYATPE